MRDIGFADRIIIAMFGLGLIFALAIGLAFLLLRRKPDDPPEP